MPSHALSTTSRQPDDPRRGARVIALDVARGVGVIAMVVGHSYDALLSATARAQPLVADYWKLRGFTAPLFMMVAGWAGTLSMLRAPVAGLGVVGRKLPRVALLLALGYALRVPAWNWQGFLQGAPAEWEHFLSFDVLHVIGVGILLGAIAIALPLPRRARGWLLVAGAAATAVVGGTPAAEPRAGLGALALVQVVGGTSPFPLVPWVSYFLAGAGVALLASEVRERRVAALAVGGAALAGAALLHGMTDLPVHDPVLVGFRMGAVLMAFAVLEGCPQRVAALLVRLGRSSLPVYVLHVAVVYGWLNFAGLAQRIGQRLAFRDATAVAALVLGATFVASEVLRSFGRRAGDLLKS